MVLTSNPKVKTVFDNYPKEVKQQMQKLRELVLKTANEIEGLDKLEETLKWGEPSYLTKHGSTLRMDWKEKKPNQFAMYFKCTSKLVPTFKAVFGNKFKYEDNRAIIFELKDKVPEKELKQCIKMTLTYHKVKNMDLLGLKRL